MAAVPRRTAAAENRIRLIDAPSHTSIGTGPAAGDPAQREDEQ